MLASILILYFLHEIFSDSRDKLKSRMLGMGGALIVAGLIVIIPLALTIQFAAISNRPESSLEIALRSSLNPINFLTFLIPNIFGSLVNGPDWGPGYGNSPLTDSTDKAFNYLFCGTFSILVLIWHVASNNKIFNRENRFFFFVLLAFMIYALGRYTPVYEILYSYVPGVSKFRRPVDATFIMVAMLAYIVPGLLSGFQRKGVPSLQPIKLVLLSCVLAWMFAAALFYSSSIGHIGDFVRELAKASVFYLLLASAAILSLKRLKTSMFAVAALMTSGELILINTANPMNAEPQGNYAVLEQEGGLAHQILGLIREDIDQTERSLAFRPRVEIAGLGGPWQNAAMVLKLEATNGYNPLRIGAYDRLVSPGEVSYGFTRKFTKAFPDYHCSLARKLGLEYLVVDRPIEELRRPEKIAHVLSAGPNVWVYRLEGVRPRVALNAQYKVADYAPLIKGVDYPGASDGNVTLVDMQPRFETPILKTKASTGSAQIKSYTPDRIEIDVQSDSAAVLTLNDIWYPGWKVYVDGRERRLLKSDVLFRGVRVEPEDRKVVFRYEPLSLDNLKAIAFQLLKLE